MQNGIFIFIEHLNDVQLRVVFQIVADHIDCPVLEEKVRR